jgi:hypothetical protein
MVLLTQGSHCVDFLLLLLDRLSFGGVKELEEIYFEWLNYNVLLQLFCLHISNGIAIVKAHTTDQPRSRLRPGVLPTLRTGELSLAGFLLSADRWQRLPVELKP